MADASSIFLSKFKSSSSTLKEVSFDKDNKVYLCNDEIQKAYDFDEIYTNDIEFFTHEYTKHFYKELKC